MQWVVDVRSATDHFPGIGRYTINLSRAIPDLLDPEERLTLLCDPTQSSCWDADQVGGEQFEVAPASVSVFSLRQQVVIPKVLRQLGAHVYHSPYYLMPYWPGVPTVLTVYDFIPVLFPEHSSARARWLFRVTLSLALRAASHVIAISQATCRDLLALTSLARDKVTVIPLAADERFRPASADEVLSLRNRYGLPPEYILYLGSNKPHKNLVRLVEAFHLLRRRRSSAVLVIAGAWDERYHESRQRAEELDMGHSVRFLGPVAEADLPALYSGAAVFVFPSLYEGFGLPVLEAMACGTPVLCSDTSSLPEVADSAALYCGPTSVGEIAEGLARLFGDQKLRTELSVRGLARAGEFSWERTAQATLQVYRRVAKGCQQPGT